MTVRLLYPIVSFQYFSSVDDGTTPPAPAQGNGMRAPPDYPPSGSSSTASRSEHNNNYPAKIVEVKRIMVVKDGEDVTLECRATGQPLTKNTVVWRRKNFQMDDRFELLTEVGRAILSIASARPQDSGIYQCVAYNGIGEEHVEQTFLDVMSQSAAQALDAPPEQGTGVRPRTQKRPSLSVHTNSNALSPKKNRKGWPMPIFRNGCFLCHICVDESKSGMKRTFGKGGKKGLQCRTCSYFVWEDTLILDLAKFVHTCLNKYVFLLPFLSVLEFLFLCRSVVE